MKLTIPSEPVLQFAGLQAPLTPALGPERIVKLTATLAWAVPLGSVTLAVTITEVPAALLEVEGVSVILRVVGGGPVAAGCVTRNVFPAMVAVPVRGDVAVLASAVRTTCPLPAPLAPEVMCSHPDPLASTLAVHLQPVPVVTCTCLLYTSDAADE